MPRALMVATIDRTIAHHLVPLALRLRDAEYEVELGCRVTGEVAGRRLSDLGLPLHDVAFSRSPIHASNVRALWQLRSILVEGRFDVVDAHTAVAGWITRLAVRLFSPRTRVIYSTHGFQFYRGAGPLRNAAFVALERIAGKWTDYLVVINREDEAAALRYGLVHAERVRYVPGMGLDGTRFDPEAVDTTEVMQVRSALMLTSSDVLLLMIAEFTPRKRHADVLRALALLQDERVHVAFAGTGRLLARTQKLAARMGLQRQTHFLGYRQDIPALIRASRAVVLVSAAEGVPKSLMESLALEVPAIGADVRGTKELVADGCGLLVPLGDAQALALAMCWMSEHPGEASAMGRNGRQRVLGQYELRNVLCAQESVYMEAVAPSVEQGR
jgi:glycosyltransferase involved in cell wall biosynthesis